MNFRRGAIAFILTFFFGIFLWWYAGHDLFSRNMENAGMLALITLASAYMTVVVSMQ